MIDPQTLVGLNINEAIKILNDAKASYGYTYQDRRANRVEHDYLHPDRYNLQIDKNDVVVRARVG